MCIEGLKWCQCFVVHFEMDNDVIEKPIEITVSASCCGTGLTMDGIGILGCDKPRGSIFDDDSSKLELDRVLFSRPSSSPLWQQAINLGHKIGKQATNGLRTNGTHNGPKHITNSFQSSS
ncbi:hypothetical protein evm_001657 [Chilo suppressalis]|nr:hypothetical protein evm_001657 [Chilo suppressalis]